MTNHRKIERWNKIANFVCVLKEMRLVWMLALLILGLVFIFRITVECQEKDSMKMANWSKYYASREADVRSSVRTILNDEGFENAGIGVTYVCDRDGKCLMTITVHHEFLSEELLLDRIADMAALESTDGMIQYKWVLS